MTGDLFERRPLLVTLGLTALLWWPLIFSDRLTYVHSPDLTGQVLPWYQVQAEAWSRGAFPTWDPYVWGGQPLVGQAQPGAVYPLNWPLFLAPLDADGHIRLRWIDLHFGLMHLVAAVFAYLLAQGLGRSRFASVAAGVAYACAGYVGAIGWPQMLNGAVWLPLTLLLFHRAWEQRSVAWAILCGGSIGLSLLSGHHQTPYFGLLALLALLAGELFRERDAGRVVGGFGIAAVALCVGALVGAMQVLPALDYGAEAYRWAGLSEPLPPGAAVPYSVHGEHRFYPITLIGLVVSSLSFQVKAFLGWTLLLAAIYGVASAWADRHVRSYTFLGAGALLFACGPLTPIHGWAYAFLPFAEKARSPSHAIYVFQLATIVLAAYGLDRFLERREEDFAAYRAAQRLLLVFAFGAFALLISRTPMGEMEVNPGDYIALSGLFALLLAAVLEGWKRGGLTAGGMRLALVALLAAELYGGLAQNWIDKQDPNTGDYSVRRYEQFDRVMAFLRSQPQPFRFDLVAGEDGQVNIGAWHGLEQISGFLASVDRDYYDFFGQVGWQEARLLMNTVYVVAEQPQSPEQQLVFEDPQSAWKVYRNPNARPRAWVVADLRSGAPAPDCHASAAPRTGVRMEITLSGVCSVGYLVVAEPHVSGRILTSPDGTKITPERFRGGLQAAAIKGPGVWTTGYECPVFTGALISGLGGVLSIGSAVVLFRRRNSR